MTIGETIQYHRKRLGLSQEDLGQQLNLSRQTVSLWENGQTVPTIDNFVRLKEIFGVSVDTLLGCAPEPKAEEKPQPVETYRFTFTDEDNEIRYKMWLTKAIRNFVIVFMILAVITIVSATNQENIQVAGPSFLFLIIYTVINIRAFVTNSKALKAALAKTKERTYCYETFYDHFTVQISRNGELTSFYKIYFSDIEKIEDTEHYYTINYGNILFDIPKKDLPEKSFFDYLANNYVEKVEKQSKTDALSVLSIVLFVASFLSLFGALGIMSFLSGNNEMLFENLWVFFTMIPIPVASVILGIILKKKKNYKYKKNIVVGCIMTAVLCIYGSFSFAVADTYTYSDEPILALEQYIDIDIPQHDSIATQDWTEGKMNIADGYVYYYSTVYFDKKEAEEFEKTLAGDDRWLPYLPTLLTGIANPLVKSGPYSHYLIYNISEDEFNTLPDRIGNHKFINAFYSESNKSLLIVEYLISYK